MSIGIPDVSRQWVALPFFGVRQAGFPFHWLTELEAPGTVSASAQFLAACAQFEQARADVRAALRIAERTGPELRPSLDLPPIRRAIELASPLPPQAIEAVLGACQADPGTSLAEAGARWNAAVDTMRRALATYEDICRHVLTRHSLAVADRFRSDRMKNVLLISNHNNYEQFEDFLSRPLRLTDGVVDRRDRGKIDTLVMYLQRVCAKNDTTSRFGPFTLGRMDAAAPSITWHGVGQVSGTAFYSHWSAEAIASAISQTQPTAPWLRPRRGPGAFLDGTTLHVLEMDFDPTFLGEVRRGVRLREPAQISQRDADLLLLCDGQRTLREIFVAWRRGHGGGGGSDQSEQYDWDGFLQRVKAMAAAGALIAELEVPVGTPDPVARLLADLPAADGSGTEDGLRSWREELEAAAGALAEFPAASVPRRQQLFRELEEQFAKLTGQAATRGLGKVYADRSLLSEEFHRVLSDLRIGGRLLRTIEDDLGPVYDLFLLSPRRRLTAERDLLADWWQARFPAGQAVSPAVFLRDFLDDLDRLEPRYLAIDREIDSLNELVRDELLPASAIGESAVTIDSQRLSALLDANSVPTPAVCNIDLMVVADSAESVRRGSFRVLVGECHAVRELLSHGPLGSFLQAFDTSFGAQVAARYGALLPADEIVADVIRSHSDKTLAQLSLPGIDVEVQGRSPKDRSQVLALHDLQVVLDGSCLRLYSPRLRTFVRLMGPPLGTFQLPRNPFTIFGWPRYYSGPPVKTAGLSHVPRLELGRTILQRERWNVPAEEFARPIAYGSARFDDIAGGDFLRAKRVQRDHGLPRHVFVKLSGEAKPVYVDFDAPLLVRQLARLARKASGRIEITEMLPGPDGLWFPGEDGPVTCELRLGMFSQVS